MANDCLVTKLKSAIVNSNLEKYGEGRIVCHLNGTDSPMYTFKWFDNGTYTIRIISGDPSINLLDSNGNSLGRTYTFSGNTIQIKLPTIQGDVVLGIDDKYNLEVISKNGNWCPTDIAAEYFMTTNPYSIHRLMLPAYSVFTDGFKSVANKKFDILQGLFTHASGDDIRGLATVQAEQILSNAEYWADYSNFVGDISTVNAATTFLKIGGNFTWITGRQSSTTILALNGDRDITGVNLGDYVDAYLNNMAQCQPISASAMASYGIISINGTRTSASDTAVATLKGMGYTIKVNGTTL